MNIYELVKLLVIGLARSGHIKKDEAIKAMRLIGKLEAENAFGTLGSMKGPE